MKKKYSALQNFFCEVFLHAYQLCASQHGAVFSASLESILFSAAMLWFALYYSKTIQQLTANGFSQTFCGWLHSHQHIYCILCRYIQARSHHFNEKDRSCRSTYSSGLSFYVTKR